MPETTQRQGVTGYGQSSRGSGALSVARAVIRAASDLVRRVQFGARAGFRSFQGHRDLYQALGYLETITLADYKERYERGGIAGGSKIPYEAFIGNEVGLRGSEQNAKAVQFRIDEYVNAHAEPLLRDLIDRFIQWGVVATPSTGDYTCKWPKEEELDEGEKADLIAKYADVNQKMHSAGERVPITPDEIREVLGFDPLPELPKEELIQPAPVVADPSLDPPVPNGTEVVQ